MPTIFKIGNNVITIKDVGTGKGYIGVGSTGVVTGIKGDPNDPWIQVLMNHTKGNCLEDESISFCEKSLRIVPTEQAGAADVSPAQTEAVLRNKRDKIFRSMW